LQNWIRFIYKRFNSYRDLIQGLLENSMENQRSILLFEQAMKTEATKKSYMYQLDKFRKYYHLKDYDSILTIQQKKLQIMVEDYLR